MYDGWTCFVGPAILSGIVVLAAWTLPHLRKQGSEVLPRHRGRLNDSAR